MAAVVLDNVYAGYDKLVLQGLSLVVPELAYVGIFGPNGAGKSTLFKVICGLLKPKTGRVTVLNRVLLTSTDRDWVRRQIGYLTQIQTPGRMPITVFDAVLLGRWGRFFAGPKRPGPKDHARVWEVLEFLGLVSLAQRDLGQLSGGQRQKVALGRALARDPELLLMDEPTTYLDPDAQAGLTAQIRELRRRFSVTIVVVTHQRQHDWGFSQSWEMEQGILRQVTG